MDEESIARISVGDRALFIRDSGAGPLLELQVSSIDKDASRQLPRRELASVSGGHVLTRPKGDKLIPERAIYRVAFSVAEFPQELSRSQWRGNVLIEARPEPALWRHLRHAAAVLVREMGF